MKTEIFKKETLANDFKLTRPIPFWSWNNKLEPEELVRQIQEMKKAGLGGFIMHARTGLITEYLSEEWFECIRVCLDEAKRLDMEAWVYDENGWPSGFAGGKLLENPENLARYLTHEIKDAFDGNAFGVYVREGKVFRRVSADEGKKEYICVYLHSSPANTDILNPDLVSQFIECTYEPYFERFGDRFGKEFAGFFTDEPQYFRYSTPYTPAAQAAYREKYGEELLDGLAYLFFTEESGYEFRQRYYKLMNALYTVNFYKRLNDWCVSHGTNFTGHSVEENALFAQMWGGAGVMPSYEHETVPGIDFLGRVKVNPLAAKQVGSVASQLGKPRVLTETFGCSGWDANPRELKFLAETQFVAGVNLMCLHLMDYSMQGQAKLDHPPTFSHHMTWWNEYDRFNGFFGRLGALISETEDLAGTLVIHPMHSVYLKYKRWEQEDVEEFDRKLSELMDELENRHVDYHFADESLLAKYGKCDSGKLTLGGKTYSNVILPHCATLDSTTKELLESYSKQSGKLLVYSEFPTLADGLPAKYDLKNNLGFDELEKRSKISFATLSGKVRYTHRRGSKFEVLYVVNASEIPAEVTLTEPCEIFEPATGARRQAPRKIELAICDSVVLLKTAEASGYADPAQFGAAKEISGNFRMVSSSDNNLTLDMIRISRNGEPFGATRYVYEVKDSLIRESFKGNLRAKYVFQAEDILPLRLRFEDGKWLSVTCNGHELKKEPSAFDQNFREADLTAFVKKGENELVFEIEYFQSPIVRYALFDPDATESLRNCLVYDTEVESVYLRGNFALGEDLILRKPNKTVGISKLGEQGFKMFSGEAVFEGEVEFESETAELSASGRFMTASVEIDGKPAGEMALAEKTTLHASTGRHSVKIVLRSSLRNTFGPFHLHDPEPLGVGPYSFTLLGSWKDGASPEFFPGYHTVKFGFDSLAIRFAK